jgi:hypothetical protein
MGMELEPRRKLPKSTWRSAVPLPPSVSLLENLGEPSLYKRAGVMRAVINLHPSPPSPFYPPLSVWKNIEEAMTSLAWGLQTIYCMCLASTQTLLYPSSPHHYSQNILIIEVDRQVCES